MKQLTTPSLHSLGTLSLAKMAGIVLIALAGSATALPAQTVEIIYSFNPSDGDCHPVAGLIQATNGDLYGTTSGGSSLIGGTGYGTVFKITTNGSLRTLHSFCSQGNFPDCADGAVPGAALVQARNGDLYGTTGGGGDAPYSSASGGGGGGTIFKVTPSGSFRTLYSFCSQPQCADGLSPGGGLVQAANGDLYGTTIFGGAYGGISVFSPAPVGGTVFKITPSGSFRTLYTFCSQPDCADGDSPQASLVKASNGELYGTTLRGGTNGEAEGGFGTVFKITPSGSFRTVYSFCANFPGNCQDGANPLASLVQASDGYLYGTTAFNGRHASGNLGGTIFRLKL